MCVSGTMLAAKFVTANEIHMVTALIEIATKGVREALKSKKDNRYVIASYANVCQEQDWDGMKGRLIRDCTLD